MDFKKVAPIVSVALAGVSTLVFALGYIEMTLFVTLLGLGGFSGLAGLRSQIQSSGYKTYIMAGAGFLTALLTGLGYVSPENSAIIMGIIGTGSLPTLQNGVTKSK